MTGTESKHVVVIGGGILGASTAAHLARSDARVTLVTAGSLADGASGRSIAWLNSSGDRSAEYHYLRLIALDRYRTWSARHPESRAYLRFDGAMKWAGPDASFRETFAFERAGGYDAVWVDRADVGTLAPDVNADAVAEDGAATGVILGDGTRLSADRVVLATGGSVPAHLAALGVTVPDATPAAFVLFTDPVDVEVTTVLNTPRVAVRPTPDGRLVLDADWAEQSVLVGDDGSITVPEDSVQGLLDEASKVLAGNPKLTAERVGAGLKPIPGDGEPVVGAVPGIAGLFTLFTHSGATLGLVLGELLAEEILTGAPSPVLTSFRLDRFDAAGLPAAVGTGAWSPVS
jgi:glycine/D-amino acid oxidase-like deaminating enzyme